MAIAACKKGITLLGTGDCIHPSWLKELQENLLPAEPGLFRLRSDIEQHVASILPPLCRSSVRFMLQTELSTIYKKGGRTRKIHHLIYLPDFEAAHKLSNLLAPFGSIASDGRPTLLLDAKSLLEIITTLHPDAFLIPAHIWTPWFSVLGSKSRFDSIEECYGELSPHIFAVETGLSSDPPMNWRVSSLDRFQLVSNSDAHSPSKIGRKASRFSCDLSFQGIRNALATGDGFEGTLEMYPQEGKYYADGHRKCGFSSMPEETRSLNNRCPCCHKPLTLGVVHRLEEIADRAPGAQRPSPKPFSYAIPLAEVLSELLHVGPSTKKVQKSYDHLTETIGPEITILAHATAPCLRHGGVSGLAEAIRRMREGKVWMEPGFDGQYGKIHVLKR